MENGKHQLWIEVYERFRRRLRILAGLIILLAVVATIDGFSNYERLAERYQSAVDLILQEQNNPDLIKDNKALYIQKGLKGAKRWDKYPEAILVEMQDIPRLYRKYVRSLAEKGNQESYVIANQNLGVHIYTLALLYGPFLISLAMLWPLLAIKKIHRRLSGDASPDDSVQQKLNSLFFDRITTHYGEGWIRHVIFSFGVLMLFALAAPVLFAVTRGMLQPDLHLAINARGMMFPLSDDPLISKILIDRHSSVVGVVLNAGILTIITYILITTYAFKIRIKQPDESV